MLILSHDDCSVIHLKRLTRSRYARHLIKRQNHSVVEKKLVDMRIAFSNILRDRAVRKFKILTDLHLLQFARGNLEHSARGVVSFNKHDLSTKTHSVNSALRPTSTSSLGWSSCDKKSDNRRSREARPSRAALFRFFACDAI